MVKWIARVLGPLQGVWRGICMTPCSSRGDLKSSRVMDGVIGGFDQARKRVGES